MKTLFMILVLCPMLVNCASNQARTKWTDPTMRVMVDPDGIEARDYIRVVAALRESGKWFVVDRRDAFKAILKEQARLHRDSPDRFKDEEKYAIWGRLYGVGGVVVAHVDCYNKPGFWRNKAVCHEVIAIASTVSGEVIATAEDDNSDAKMDRSGDIKIGVSWTKAVAKLNKAYPENYEPMKYSDEMTLHRAEVKEEAVRQKENIGRDQASQQGL